MKLLKHIQFSYFGTYTAEMKLLIILSIVACTYADKLDRTYLPPPNAGSAGGSPGSLIAPGLQPTSSSSPLGSANFGSRAPTNFNQGSSNGPAQNGQGFGPAGFGRPSGSSNFGSSNVGQDRLPSSPQPGFSGSSALNQGFQGKPGQGQQLSYGQTGVGSQGIGFDVSKSVPSFGAVAGATLSGDGLSQGSRQSSGSQPSSFNQGLGFGQSNAYAVPQPERPQASADRNAEILKYDNENNGESYNYSYETSNGISAEESGVATNGVRAQGGYAYTGDDGYQYSVTYTADENGYQPQGEHLPTPHPIPEEILKSIEENAKAAAAGTQEGAYRPEEYESEDSLQQYKAGQSAYNRPQGQGQGIGINQPQGNNILGSLGMPGQGYGQAQSSQAPNQFSSGQNGFKAPSNQFEQNFDNQNQVQQGQRKDFSGQNLGQNAQGAQKNGYQYNQPQNGFGSSSPVGQLPSIQKRPQIAPQGPSSFAPSSSSQDSGLSGQGNFGLSSNSRSEGSNFQGTQNQLNSDTSRPSYQQPGNQGGVSSQGQQPSFGPNQAVSAGITKPGQQSSFGLTQPSFGAGGIANQGQQAPFRSSQSSFGSFQPSFGPQKQSISSNGASDQGYQYGLKANQPAFNSGNQIRPSSQPFGNKPSVNGGSSQSPSLVPGAQNGFSSAGARPQYQQNGNQQSFGSDNLNQGPQSGVKDFEQSGAQPGSRGPQPGQQPQYQSGQQPSFGPSSSPNGRPSQAGPAAGSQFGGPRQPPSFSPQEGYKY